MVVGLFEEFKIGKKLIMLSDLTLQELEFARDEVREKVKEIPKKQQIAIGVTDEAIELAETYINEGALTLKNYNDALHIALATLITLVYYVNLNRIRLYKINIPIPGKDNLLAVPGHCMWYAGIKKMLQHKKIFSWRSEFY